MVRHALDHVCAPYWGLFLYAGQRDQRFSHEEERGRAINRRMLGGTVARYRRGYPMPRKKAVMQLLLLCGAVGLSSCAGRPPTPVVAQVSQAELAVQQASKSKAPDYASVELYTAREQLAAAQ